jgi:hypothetical protein
MDIMIKGVKEKEEEKNNKRVAEFYQPKNDWQPDP